MPAAVRPLGDDHVGAGLGRFDGVRHGRDHVDHLDSTVVCAAEDGFEVLGVTRPRCGEDGGLGVEGQVDLLVAHEVDHQVHSEGAFGGCANRGDEHAQTLGRRFSRAEDAQAARVGDRGDQLRRCAGAHAGERDRVLDPQEPGEAGLDHLAILHRVPAERGFRLCDVTEALAQPMTRTGDAGGAKFV